MLVSSSRRNSLSQPWAIGEIEELKKVRDRETRSPARGTRSLPGIVQTAVTYNKAAGMVEACQLLRAFPFADQKWARPTAFESRLLRAQQ